MSSNLYELISKDNQIIPESSVKQYMYQVLVALEYIHGYINKNNNKKKNTYCFIIIFY